MSSYVFLNGAFLARNDASIHVSDLAIQRGFAIFDFFRTQNGVPFMIEDHLDRFEKSAALLNLEMPYSRLSIQKFVDQLMSYSKYETAGIKLILTGGESLDGLTPTSSNFIINIQPITFPDNEMYRTGVKLITTEYRRDIPQAKTVNYAKVISMRDQLVDAGAVDVLFKFQGEVYETSRSNFFLIKEDVIKTQKQDVLKGITRKIVIELAREAGYRVEEGSLSVDWVYQADEAFITGTTKKVMPVVDLNGRRIGKGVPGEKTKHLRQLFAEFEKNWNVVTRA